MQIDYNFRHKLIKKKELGKDELVDKILSDSTCPEAVLYEKALEVNSIQVQKSYMESCLLASNDMAQIAEILDMEIEVIQMYHDIFYEVGTLNKLRKLSLLDGIDDKEEQLMKIWALNQGIIFISWRLNKVINLSPIEGLTDLFATCMFKSKEALFNSNSTEASKESTKWVKLSLDIARLLKLWSSDDSGAKRDLEIAIQEVIPNFGSIDDILEQEGLIDSDPSDSEPD